ncbi:MAG: hypothetical protein GY838_12155 [bacterium]|nr:hypothetical protein [bacterium]
MTDLLNRHARNWILLGSIHVILGSAAIEELRLIHHEAEGTEEASAYACDCFLCSYFTFLEIEASALLDHLETATPGAFVASLDLVRPDDPDTFPTSARSPPPVA